MTDIVERLRAGPNGKHDPAIYGEMLAAAAEIERLRALQSMVIEVIDASDDLTAENARLRDMMRGHTATAWDLGKARAENERLRAALESLTEDPPATLDEPDADWEVIVKMRAIATAALDNQQERRNLAPGDLSVEALKNTKMDARHEPLNALVDQQPMGRAAPDELTAETERLGLYDPPKEG
jgi:hypothetical protein